MAELLLELFSEEIPARMQGAAARDLERLVSEALKANGLAFETARAFAGPRRLALSVTGLPARQPDVTEEKKGPRVGAPEKAIEGFLKSAGVRLADCETRSDAKGEFYVAVIERKGRATREVLPEILPAAIAKVPWPKSMRWGTGEFRWVRPLHSIVATLDGDAVPFALAGVTSGNVTWGHRFLSKGPLTVKRFDDYAKKLRGAHVVLDAEERKAIIEREANAAARKLGLEVVPDPGLLEEVAGLAEWPVVLIGSIDARFMELPPEILSTAMRAHQKYFALRDPKTGALAPRFAVVANMMTADGGREIVAGNERVLRARLSDAGFFWNQDRRRTLESRVADLEGIVFHARAGSLGARARRLAELSAHIAELLGCDRETKELARKSGLLAKADLVSNVVGEFPELQGVMGSYYARHDGEPPEVCDAIREHYSPIGQADLIPAKPVSIAVAIADKIDTLVELWYAGEKPSGSGDPYALRRAAIGVIRIVLENRLRLPLRRLIRGADFAFEERVEGVQGLAPTEQLLEFFADRLKVALREKGTRHDLIDAVFSLGSEDDLVRLVARVEALQDFLKTDDGANLLTGYRRAANILRIEEKKDNRDYRDAPDPSLLREPEEGALAAALEAARKAADAALAGEDFRGAMAALARLRAPVDRFFDKVTVNAGDAKLRENRLKLLAAIVETARTVADFSKIEG